MVSASWTDRLAGVEIEGRLSVVPSLIGFRIGVALALGRDHVHKHRTTGTVGVLERADHLADVMAVDRTHVGEAQLFKHRTNLGHSKAPHAALESIEFSWYFASHERKIRTLSSTLPERNCIGGLSRILLRCEDNAPTGGEIDMSLSFNTTRSGVWGR